MHDQAVIPLAAERRDQGRVDVDDPALVVGRDLDEGEEAAEDHEVGPAVADRLEDRGAEVVETVVRSRVARDTGMLAASARSMAPIRGLLATTWTISARSRPAAIWSIRFWSVVPPPETQTARRIGGTFVVIGGSRGASDIGQTPPLKIRAGAQCIDNPHAAVAEGRVLRRPVQRLPEVPAPLALGVGRLDALIQSAVTSSPRVASAGMGPPTATFETMASV